MKMYCLLSLNWVSSDHTVFVTNSSSSFTICWNHSQNCIRRSGWSSSIACNNLGMYTFHLRAFRMRRTLVLLTPVSRAHCVAEQWRCCKPFQNHSRRSRTCGCKRFSGSSPMHFTNGTMCIKLVTKPCNCQACLRLCLKLTLTLTLNFSNIFKLNWIIITILYVVVWCFLNRCRYSHDCKVMWCMTYDSETRWPEHGWCLRNESQF